MAPEKHRPLARGDACHTCKGRKVRCPGERPICSRCKRLKKQCQYAESPSESPNSAPTPSTDLSNGYAAPSMVTVPSFQYDTSSMLNSTASTSTAQLPPSTNLQFDDIFNYNTANPTPVQPAAYSGSSTLPDTQGFSLIPYGEASMPLPSNDFQWDWNSIDLEQLLGLPKEPVNELSDSDRDHLLLLYFTNFRLFGMQVHLPTLYSRIHATDPEDRPHPCLLYAMFLVSSRLSSMPHLREKEGEFLDRARSELEKAIAKEIKPVHNYHLYDAVRAGTLISMFLYAKDSFLEAQVMTGQVVRLAIGCGLDRIPSSTYIAGHPDKRRNRLYRRSEPLLGAPKSRTELGERICAFWCLFLVDRCANAALHWPAGFDADKVLTPLPRSWAEYESDLSHNADCDETLPQFLQETSKVHCKHDTVLSRLLKGVVLLHAAATSSPHDPKIQEPLQRFKSELSKENDSVTLTRGSSALEFIILGTELYLEGAGMFAIPEANVLEVVQRMLEALKVAQQKDLGDHSMFITSLWSKMARLTVLKCKDLERENDFTGAAKYRDDVEYIISCLRPKKYILAQNAVMIIDQWKDMPWKQFFEEEMDPYILNY